MFINKILYAGKVTARCQAEPSEKTLEHALHVTLLFIVLSFLLSPLYLVL